MKFVFWFLDLFPSYLQNIQLFYANGVQSDKMPITCCAPQNSDSWSWVLVVC